MDERISPQRSTTRPPRGESAIWGPPVLFGALTCLLGISCMGAAATTSYTAILLTGVLLVLAGGIGIYHGVRRHDRQSGALATGILSLVVGVLLFAYPRAALAAVTLLLIGYFFTVGVYRVVTSLADRYENWQWDFAYGLFCLALGAVAVRSWPLSAFVLLGVLVGAEIFARGVTMTAIGLTARHELRTLRGAGAPA